MEDLERIKHERYEQLKKYLQEMKPFTDFIPEVPKMQTPEDYEEYVVKNYIRCGAIPKKDLMVGKTYIGDCRNASEATWKGDGNLWYLVEPMDSNYVPKTKIFKESSMMGIMEGSVIFIETR